MGDYPYVIVGGGLAGGKAIEGIRDVDAKGDIALVTEEPHRPYQRPPLSKGVLTGKRPEDVVYLDAETTYPGRNVALLTGVRVATINREAQAVTLSDGRVLRYEALLLATGGRPRRLALPGNALDGVLTLRTIEDARRIRDLVGPATPALVLGGSFIGSEVAAGLSTLGADVTMVFPEGRLLERIVPAELSARVQEIYAAHHVRIMPGITPQRFVGETRVTHARLSDGSSARCDVVVMGVGIALNTELALQAGLDLRADDKAVVVNEHLRTSDPHIYAAGDIAAWPDPTFKKRLRVEHWDVARAQGLQAGRNMAGAGERYDVIPYFFSDLFDLSFEAWGDLSAWTQTVRRGDLESGSVAYFYFNEGRLVGVLAIDRPDDERDPMQALVKARPTFDDVGARLGEESVDLAHLA